MPDKSFKESVLGADTESLQRKTGEIIGLTDAQLTAQKNSHKAQLSNTLLQIQKVACWIVFTIGSLLALWGVGYFLCLTVMHIQNVLPDPNAVKDLISSFVQAFLTVFATLFFSDKFMKK